MIVRKFLSGVPFVLCSLLAADAGGGSGNGNKNPPEPTGETLEAKLTHAKSIIADFFKQLSGAFKERDDAVTGLASEKTAHEATKGALTTEKAAHVKTAESLSTMTGDRDNQKSGREKAEKEVGFLESFCKAKGIDLKGVDRSKAVPALTESPAPESNTLSRAEFSKLTPAAQSKHCLSGGKISD
jgi:hypothetical protein